MKYGRGLKILLKRILRLKNNNYKYISTKIKSQQNKIRSDFKDGKLPPEITLLATYLIILIEKI